jgi:hypothetical protein
MGWIDGMDEWEEKKEEGKKKKMLQSHMDVCRAMQRDAMP